MKKTKIQVSANGKTLESFGVTTQLSLEKSMQKQIRQGLIDSKLDVSHKFTIPIEKETWVWMKQFILPEDLYWWEATYFIHSKARSSFIPDNQIQVGKTWIIVEVDPHEHVSYHVDLERFRQLYITAYLLKNKNAEFVKFFRINPGRFSTLEKQNSVSMSNRVSTLIFFVNHFHFITNKLKNPNSLPFSFFYLYYSSTDVQNDFPSCLKDAPLTIQHAVEFSWTKDINSFFRKMTEEKDQNILQDKENPKSKETKETKEEQKQNVQAQLILEKPITSKDSIKGKIEKGKRKRESKDCPIGFPPINENLLFLLKQMKDLTAFENWNKEQRTKSPRSPSTTCRKTVKFCGKSNLRKECKNSEKNIEKEISPQVIKNFIAKLQTEGWKGGGSIHKKHRKFRYHWRSLQKNDKGAFKTASINLEVAYLSEAEKSNWAEVLKSIAKKSR